MMRSYEAVYEEGQLKWVDGQPDIASARVIVTILEETHLGNSDEVRRTPPLSIDGKGRTLGDLVGPIVPEEDWDCLK